jgi:quercetin dioxygenase-like cupin family protein
MTDIATRQGHGHGGHGQTSETLGWESPADRLVDLLQKGATLTRVERMVAEAELAKRERRKRSPVVTRGKDLVFEPSSWKGVEIGYVISPYLHGIEVENFTLEMHRIAPGTHTSRHRHWERVCHILAGRGYTLFGEKGEKRIEWGPHDSLHIKMGEWHQHFVTSDEPAMILAGKTDLVAGRLGPYRLKGTGDSFSDLPEDFRPEHPFTQELITIAGVEGGEKWMAKHQQHARGVVDRAEQELREAPSIMRASDVVIERSEHKGDYRAALIEPAVGFASRMLAMYVQQLPPGCHTETHRHGEAIVYVLSGSGYSIVDGVRHEWQAGDCIFIQPLSLHQHFNPDPKRYSQHLTVNITPIKGRTLGRAMVGEADET